MKSGFAKMEKADQLCAGPGFERLFDLSMAFGTAGGHISAAAPNGSHKAQLLGNLIQRGLLGEPLQGIHYSLFVRHESELLLGCFEGKWRMTAASCCGFS